MNRYTIQNGKMTESESGEYILYSDHKYLMDIYKTLDKKLSSMIDSYLSVLFVHSVFDSEKFQSQCEEIYKLRDIVNPGWRDNAEIKQ